MLGARKRGADRRVASADTDRAYAAAFLDAEGCIRITINRPKKLGGVVPVYCLCVQVGNTDPAVVTWLADMWGGSLHAKRARIERNQRGTTTWFIVSTEAARFLGDVLPFLKMKKAQAILGLDFQGRMRRTRIGNPRTPAEIAEQVRAFDRMKILNARGLRPPTP